MFYPYYKDFLSHMIQVNQSKFDYKERRTFPRSQLKRPFSILFWDTKDLWQTSTLIDISHTGIRFIVAREIPLGKTLHVKIKLVDRKAPLLARCSVVWSRSLTNDNSWYECGGFIQAKLT